MFSVCSWLTSELLQSNDLERNFLKLSQQLISTSPNFLNFWQLNLFVLLMLLTFGLSIFSPFFIHKGREVFLFLWIIHLKNYVESIEEMFNCLNKICNVNDSFLSVRPELRKDIIQNTQNLILNSNELKLYFEQ